jgi:hypothetical protein
VEIVGRLPELIDGFSLRSHLTAEITPPSNVSSKNFNNPEGKTYIEEVIAGEPDNCKPTVPDELTVPLDILAEPAKLKPILLAAATEDAALTSEEPKEPKPMNPKELTVPEVTVDVPDTCKLTLLEATTEDVALTDGGPLTLKTTAPAAEIAALETAELPIKLIPITPAADIDPDVATEEPDALKPIEPAAETGVAPPPAV